MNKEANKKLEAEDSVVATASGILVEVWVKALKNSLIVSGCMKAANK